MQTEVRPPAEVLTGRFGYGFKLGLMKKDTGIGAGLLGQHLEHDAMLPRVAAAVEDAVGRLGAEADYTEVVRHLEEVNGEGPRVESLDGRREAAHLV